MAVIKISELPQVLSLGNQSEQGKSIQFDVSEWNALYPGARYEITYIRPGETGSWPATGVNHSNGTLTWVVSRSVTLKAGQGSFVIHCYVGEDEKNTGEAWYFIGGGHEIGETPDAVAEWLAETAVSEALRETAETARETAEGLRDTAEGLRSGAETSRNTAEGLRLSAEISRNTAEGLRGSAEIARKEAETLRVEAEAVRMGFVPKGAYNPANENKYGEWYTHEGGSYGYIYPTPSTGVPVTNTSHWQQIASVGGQDILDAVTAEKNAAIAAKVLAEGYAAQLAAGTASPAGTYADLDDLNSGTPATPNTAKIYITLDDGQWCYYNGSAWVAGGVYLGSTTASNITTNKPGVSVQNKLSSLSIDVLNPLLIPGVEETTTLTINLFDRQAVTIGGYYSPTTGLWVNDDTYVTSDFIPVSPGEYKGSSYFLFSAWDVNKSHLPTGVNPVDTFTVVGAKYVKISVKVEDLRNFVLLTLANYLQRPFSYEPFGDINKFNPLTVTEVSESHVVSEDISILPGIEYTHSRFVVTYSFYTADKTFLASWDSNEVAGFKLAAGSSARYVRIELKKEEAASFMFAKSSDIPFSYTPPRKLTLAKNIWDNPWADHLNSIDPLFIEDISISSTPSINLVDSRTIRKGFYNGGVWTEHAYYVSTDFIPVSPGTYKTFGRAMNYSGWDSNKNHLVTYGMSSTINIVSAAYITINFAGLEEAKEFMLVKEDDVDKLESKYVPYDGVENLFDLSTVIPNKVYDNSGDLIDSPLYSTTDFIPLIPGGDLYNLSHPADIKYWNSEKQFIVSQQNGLQMGVGGSSLGRFATLSIKNSDVSSFMYAVSLPKVYIPRYKYSFGSKWELPITDTPIPAPTVAAKYPIFEPSVTPPIELHLPDFSGYNQPYHPSVVYIAGNFAGYPYWMVQTPFPIGATPYRDRWECPIVYKSTDGIAWIPVADPLDDLTPSEISNGDYMSDPHILYRADTSTLEVWYRISYNGTGMPTEVLRKVTTDGSTWSEREIMIPARNFDTDNFFRSPAFIYEDNKYKAWYQNNFGLFYNESVDGKSWPNQTSLTLDKPPSAWHIDVAHYSDKYHLVIYSQQGQVVYYSSDDGLSFKREGVLLDSSDGNPLYSNGLYRSISMLDADNKVRLYFSATKYINKTRVGLIIANSLSDMIGVKTLNANRIVLGNGLSLEEAYAQIMLRLPE